MTTSTNKSDSDAAETSRGAFADGLTFVRISLTPVIMVLLISRWPEVQIAILISVLFILAALTDLLDDMIGGRSQAQHRHYGYLDDAADTILIIGTLLALFWVIFREGLLHWAFSVPVIILIAREVIIGLFKGYELSRYGWPDNRLSNAKTGFAVLGVSLLVASPWLTPIFDQFRAGSDQVMEVYSGTSPWIWVVGQLCLWVAAVFSLWSGWAILKSRRDDEDVFHA
jgi:phosphatidylglycerophosphate synthase